MMLYNDSRVSGRTLLRGRHEFYVGESDFKLDKFFAHWYSAQLPCLLGRSALRRVRCLFVGVSLFLDTIGVDTVDASPSDCDCPSTKC